MSQRHVKLAIERLATFNFFNSHARGILLYIYSSPIFRSPTVFPSIFPPQSTSLLNQGNALNFNGNALWQLLNRNTAPGRLVREELLVGSVHLSEVVHGGDENVNLDNLLERRASSFENSRQVGDALLGHLADVVGSQGEDLAGGRAWNLAGAVDGGAGLDGLGVRARGWEEVSKCSRLYGGSWNRELGEIGGDWRGWWVG